MATIGAHEPGGHAAGIRRVRVAPCVDALGWWDERCAEVSGFLAQVGRRGLQDAVWVVPLTAHVAQARAAWARTQAGWMPEVVSVAQLQSRWTDSPATAATPLGLDPGRDRCEAMHLLRSTAFGAAMERDDPRAFDGTVSRLVRLATALFRAVARRRASERSAWADDARRRLAGTQGVESALARLALEWALQFEGCWLDAAFEPAPSAMVVLQHGPPASEGGAASLARRGAELGIPVLCVESPAPPLDTLAPPRLQVCDDFEDEARATAAHVLEAVDALDAGAPPVALVAQDRRLVRRVRPWLEAAGVGVLDETGWTLSTTRAAATVHGLLKLTQRDIASDDVLGWLKSTPIPLGAGGGVDDEDQLEAVLRRAGWTAPWPQGLPPTLREALGESAVQLWEALLARVDLLRWSARLPLSQALLRWRSALAQLGVLEALAGDDAGRQVLLALHLDEGPMASDVWGMAVTVTELQAWANAVLEATLFKPSRDPAQVHVVVTPLNRVHWRPFSAMVFPAADALHLGARPEPLPWISPAECRALGLTEGEDESALERWIFDTLLHTPGLALLRRKAEGDAAVMPSAWVEHAELALRRRGLSWLEGPSPVRRIALDAAPVHRPQPHVERAPGLWPESINATAYESLRTCPYQFYARAFLGLRRADELDESIERRDVGNWIHDVLQAFHEQRAAPGDAAADRDLLQRVAADEAMRHGLDTPAFLPYRIWFDQLAPAYLQWLAEWEQVQGHRFMKAECELRTQSTDRPTAGPGLHGRLDRIDRQAGATGVRTMTVIDYKTGSKDRLKRKLRPPQEDAQLPFYAALLRHTGTAEAQERIEAVYLALEADPVEVVRHRPGEVEALAQGLVDQLAEAWLRLRQGHPMPPLGEGDACEYCDMRGLCRRDHWSEASAGDPA